MKIKTLLTLLPLAAILITSCNGKTTKSVQQSDIIANQLDSLISAEEKQGFHGVVLIEKDGNKVLSKGYGYANEATKLEFSPTTFVQIGSNVKDFTKAAIYQLVENGKLKLDQPLSKFITGLTGNKKLITVQHLIAHRSGFPIGIKMDQEPFSTAEMIAAIQGLELKAEPGSKEIYSNLGYSCLAYIIEQVSGKSFDTYVHDNILKPAGLVNTGTYLPKFDQANIAHGYKEKEDIGIILDMPHDDNGHLWSLRGNGGYLSTAEEMNTYYHALENSSLLKTDAYRKAVFNPAEFNVLAGSDRVSFFLISNLPGLKTRVIIATNHSDYPGPRLMRKIEGLLFGNNSGTGNAKGERKIELGDGNEEGKEKYTGPLLEKLPATGAGITISKYIETFNTGDADKMRKYFEEYAKTVEGSLPIERRLENFKNIYADLGKLTVLNVNASQEAEGIWEVAMTTSTGNPANFIFRVEPKSPWKFEGLQIMIGD